MKPKIEEVAGVFVRHQDGEHFSAKDQGWFVEKQRGGRVTIYVPAAGAEITLSAKVLKDIKKLSRQGDYVDRTRPE